MSGLISHSSIRADFHENCDRPTALDLFGGGCGAAWGYVLAGFCVTSVDNHTRKHLPSSPHLQHVNADALELLLDIPLLRSFDLRHGSPPCQTETALVELRRAQGKGTDKVNLIPETRAGFEAAGGPYVIENVPRSSVRPDFILCGSSFGLKVRRHRLFESNVAMFGLPCDHKGQGRPVGVYGSKGDDIPSGGSTARTLEEGRAAMGIDWMSWSALVEAIPPAYTEFIGAQLLEQMERAA